MTESIPADYITHLQALAAKHSSSAALLAPGRPTMSFGELVARARAIGAQLAAWGIHRGDIVAWPTADRPTSALALATMPASATLALLSPGLTVDAYETLLRRLRPKAVATSAGTAHAIVEAARRLGVAEISVMPDPDGPAGAFDLELCRSRASLEAAPVIVPETLFILATSGTTGRPKLVPQRQDQLLAMARATGAFFALGPADIAGHLTALHLSAGMRSSFMMSLLNGGAVNCLPEADVDAFMAAAGRGDVTYMSASFAMYREILRRIESGRRVTRGRLRFLRVGAGRIEPEEIDRLAAAYGVPVVTGLASSETCMIAHQRLNSSERSRGSVGAPLATEVRIVDDQGREAAQGEPGEIQVRGAQVFPGYFDDEELNRQAFVDGWFRTGDAAFVDDRGELHIVGRLNEIINRGGEKISPVEVDTVLRALPGVRDAAAFAVPHPRLGEELVAAVVRAPDCALDSAEMIGRVRAKLGARRAPRRLWFVDALPRNDAGKVQRRMLPQHVGFDSAAPAALPDVAPERLRSPLEVALSGLWASTLHVVRVDPDEDFFMLGGDSLRGAQLLDEVRAVFGVEIPVDALFDDAGTVAAMARRIETARTAVRERPLAIPRRAAGTVVPLSSTQARVWFLQRLEPGNTAYHEARLWRIDGELDLAALSAAIAAVAARHSMLRTRFVSGALGPVQVIDDESDATLEIVDLPSPGDGDGPLGEAVRAHATRPFDLEAATPLRWTLFRLGPDRYALLRVWHHIVGDALSARLLQQEVSEAYAAARAGRDVALPELPIEYADYAVWQNDEQAGFRNAPQLTYWQDRLAGLPILALPTDFRRPPAQSFRGGSVTTSLPREAAAALKAVGRERGATSFVTFLAAFSALLSRLSGDVDFGIGTPVAGRTLPELNHLIGFLANTVVFRADVAGTPTVEELLARTRADVRDALRHQDVPFKVVVDALAAPRDPSRNPLFQVAFAMREYDPVDMRFEGAQTRRIDSGIERAKFDLTLTLIERPDRIDARWEYCADLFQRSTIERISRQYATLIDAMAAAPTQPVATLPLMDAAARQRIAADACRSSEAPTDSATIAERFAAQVQATPAAMAIESITYADLDAAANRLARDLLANDVAAHAIVAVARRSSADIAVAWLAVLKAGAAYLPVDPDLPPERIAYMLTDARVSHAIADAKLAGLLTRPGVRVIVPEMEAERIAARAPELPATETRPDDPAYVIYTSGSTGSPKGVLIPHRAVLRLVRGTDCAQLGPDDRLAQIANPAFDASTFEFWGALLNGARIVPIPKTTAIAPRALAAAIAQEGVTALFLTTALFNAVAREAPDAFRTCRYVLFGGEAVEPHWVGEVVRAGPPRHLLHVYGPTEATTFATWHEVREVAPNAVTIPIGRPLMNNDVFVLRPDLELAAPGEPGELCIGGPGLALGYLNATQQLSARFVEHAIAPLPPRRIYRSGDRVRLRDDAAIEFLGRHDRQVKIRGHRIELGEIEAAIVSLPQVSAAAVMVRGDTAETRQIVAYVVRADPSQPPPANLWSALRPLLPDYMLPASIMWLPSLPLNASGKIDWRALPAVVPSGAARPGVPVAPRDMMEQVLVHVWERVLNGTGIGVHDHFFEIGGHSLLAARLVDEIERESGIAIPLAALFADDTIAGLAQVLREGAAGLDAPIVAINDEGALPPFVFLHGDLSGGGFYSRSLAHALGPDQPVLVVHPHGLDAAPIPDTIEAMAADRIKALRVRRPHGPYLLGGYCNGAFVAFEMARQLVDQGEDVPAVVIIEARAPAGGREPDPPAAGERYVTFDRGGAARMLMPHDRQSDAQLRFTRAIERYAGGTYAGHVVIVRSRNLDDARPDIGWARLAGSTEIHVLNGDHVTIVTHQVDQLAKVTRAIIDRVQARVVQ